MREIETFINNSDEHNKLLIEILNISEGMIGKSNLGPLNRVLKLIPNDDINRYDKATIHRYNKVANYIIKNKKQLLNKIITSNEKMRKIYKIIEDFEHFLKENSLELPEKHFEIGVATVKLNI